MVKSLLLLLICLTSCSIVESTKLVDGLTKVPNNKDFFNTNYRDKYDIFIVDEITLNSIFIESYSVSDNRIFNLRNGYNSYISGLKFYNNGCLNSFLIDKTNIDSLGVLDPTIQGYRGISYLKKKDTLIDIYVPLNDNYKFGKKTYKVNIKKDSLFLTNAHGVKYVYLRKKLSKKNLIFKANW